MKEHPENEIIQRQLDTDSENPAVEVAEAVAEIEGVEATDLGTTYECIDGMLDELFSNPPSLEAQMRVEFSYEDYRITVDQEGNAEFVKTS